MTASSALWSVLQILPMPVAARLASTLYRDRDFSVDHGHWVNRQDGATFVSPDINAKRLSLVEETTADEWFWTGTPRGIAFDIGAGIGEEAVILSRTCDHVYAIEAHPDVYACLVETVRRSGLSNVTPIHCALAAEDGEVRISTGKHHLANGIGGDGGEADDGIPVPARSLKSLCDELGIARIDYLKMNIEGAERLAIQGLGDIEIRDLIISCHDFIPGDFTRTRDLVKAFLDKSGYDVRARPDHPHAWTRNMLYARKA